MTIKNKHSLRKWTALGLLLAVLVTSFPLSALAGNSALKAVEITPNDRSYDFVTSGKRTYTYDFTSTEITDYSTDEALATASLRTNMILGCAITETTGIYSLVIALLILFAL